MKNSLSRKNCDGRAWWISGQNFNLGESHQGVQKALKTSGHWHWSRVPQIGTNSLTLSTTERRMDLGALVVPFMQTFHPLHLLRCYLEPNQLAASSLFASWSLGSSLFAISPFPSSYVYNLTPLNTFWTENFIRKLNQIEIFNFWLIWTNSLTLL